MTEFPMNFSNSKNDGAFDYFNKFFPSNTIKIKSFLCKGNKVVFKKPYVISFYKNENGFYADDDFLDVHCFGETVEDLKEDLIDELAEIYNGYVNVDENELDKSGLRLRDKFICITK